MGSLKPYEEKVKDFRLAVQMFRMNTGGVPRSVECFDLIVAGFAATKSLDWPTIKNILKEELDNTETFE